jgi:hypothetical protein
VDPTGVLLLCLVSMVHHSDFLKTTAAENNSHPFKNLLPLLHDNALLQQLKAQVTTEPEGQMLIATAVKEAYKDRAEESGQVTMLDQFHESMIDLVDQRLADIKNSIQTAALPQDNNDNNHNDNNDDGNYAPGEEVGEDVEEQGQHEQQQPTRRILYRNYSHDGCFWHLPRQFLFPQQVRLNTDWMMWLTGLPEK